MAEGYGEKRTALSPVASAWSQKLSSVDLSEYFWLVRDRLASSQIGLSLTPPAVKASYDALLSDRGARMWALYLRDWRGSGSGRVDQPCSLQGLQRDSKNAEAYNAFLKVAETIPSTMSVFGALIKNLPSDNLPGWLSGKLELVVEAQRRHERPVDRCGGVFENTDQ